MIWRFFINPIMIFILRSPFHFFVSHSVLVLYVTGAKTGKKYFIPVSFFEHRKGLLTCVTDKPNIWWRNLTSIDEIKILFKGKEIQSKIKLSLMIWIISIQSLMPFLSIVVSMVFLEVLAIRMESPLRKM